MKNVGPRTRVWLEEAGIHSLDDLEALGPVEAYVRLKRRRPREVSLNALWALQGALWNIHWNDVPRERREQLRAEAEARLRGPG